MIIYGWGNFNRRDHSLVRDTCRSCGHTGYLKSYTSSKFFTLYFIPIIPLGRQRIVQDCPHCKQAFGMSLGKWRKLGRTELPRALAEVQAKPADPEAARQALALCVQLQDRNALRSIGPQVRTTFARDADMLGYLAGAYSYLCMDKEADAAYLDAVALAPDGPIAAQAAAHLELQKLPRPTPPNRLLQSLPVLIVPAIVLFVALGYVQKAFTGAIDSAYVVNGLDRAYTVEINGRRHTLMPHQVLRSDALETGRNTLAPVGGAAFPAPETFDIDVSFWARLTQHTTVVVNPDRAAVITHERTTYAYPKPAETGPVVTARAGEIVHVYQDLDYEFRDFPAQISMSGSGAVERTRVASLGAQPLPRVVHTLAADGRLDELAKYLRARVRAGSDDPSIIHLASRYLARPEFLELAAEKLAVRPVLIEWHRAYQTLLNGTPEGRDLESTYRAFVEKDPQDSTLLYLLARLSDDPAVNVPLLERAALMEQPSAYAANALAYHHVLAGGFSKAFTWSELAVRLEPNNEQFKSVRRSALYGAHDYAMVEREMGDALLASDQRLQAFYDHVYRLAKLRRDAEIPLEIGRLVQRMKAMGEMNDAEEKVARAYLESAAALASGDRTRYEHCITRLPGPAFTLQGALVTADTDRIQKLGTGNAAVWSTTDHLVAYVILSRRGRPEPAADQLAKAVEKLKAGTGDEQRWAAWLESDDAPAKEAAFWTCPNFDQHSIFLTALAERFPGLRAELLPRATKIRWSESYATLALDGVLGE